MIEMHQKKLCCGTTYEIVKAAQGSGKCEHMHKTVAELLQTFSGGRSFIYKQVYMAGSTCANHV